MTEELKTDIIINRDALFALRELPDESVNCCVTSPPYYALRDYGLDAQIGREDTPEEYIERLVAVFHELKRVLRSDGTFWLNIADTYCGTGNKGYYADPKNPKGRNGQQTAKNARAPGCKQKDLIGIPWLLAFALRADGWYLRSDIIWQKENPMPESCKDRPSRCYEHKEQTAGQEQPEQEAEKAAEPDKDTFSIYQLKRGDETRDFRFEPYDRLQAAGLSVEAANYDLIYTAPLTPDMTLESIWEKFNIDHPKDFKGHSLSVSDVVVLHQNGQDTAHYVDSFGYKNVPEFLQEQKQLTPDELETGETIKTPRGTFYVTDMSHEQMEAAGYGFHHQSDDGKYFIMGNGTRAFAIAAEPPENYLKTAEQTTEQNYNMIDGQINNTPTVDELEAKVKAGETISLVDLANAVKADKERGKAKPEKKPSIRAQLLADKEKAQKKPAKQKSQDLERS